jgi:hypothetical protein
LTLRARMRCFETWYAQGNRNSAPASGAYLQITCSFPSGAILTSQKPAPILEGYTHWALYHAKVTVPKGWKPERVQMNLVLPPHNEPLGPALVGLKDIELVKSPATGPPQPVLSRRFDPAKDKLLHGKAKVQDGGWRIDHEGRKNKTGAQDGNIPERVRLFQVTDVTIPKGGPFILRAKLKAQGSPPTVGASLSMGPEPAKSAINDGFREVSSNDWAIYETSYPVSKFHNVTAIPLDLLLYGLGTTWIKDVELLYLPDAGGGKNVAEV